MKGSGPSASSQHTWLTSDRKLLFASPSDDPDNFPDSTLVSDVPLVFGANAHAQWSADLNARVADWSRYDDYAAKVESR